MHWLASPLFESKKSIFWFLFYLCLYVYVHVHVCVHVHECMRDVEAIAQY